VGGSGRSGEIHVDAGGAEILPRSGRELTEEHLTPLCVTPRAPLPASFDARRGRRERVKARGLRALAYGDEELDLSGLERLVDDSQARAIGAMLKRPGGAGSTGPALPRAFEVAAAVNRLRSLRVEPMPRR
jgi:hypothetical protein